MVGSDKSFVITSIDSDYNNFIDFTLYKGNKATIAVVQAVAMAVTTLICDGEFSMNVKFQTYGDMRLIYDHLEMFKRSQPHQYERSSPT